MTRLIAIAAIAGSLIGVGSASAKVYLYSKSEGSLGFYTQTYKPTRLNVGYYPVSDIHWHGWGSGRAVGFGNMHGYKVKLVASRPTSNMASYRFCQHETPMPLTHYYGRLSAQVYGPHFQADLVHGNQAVAPTVQC